MQKFIPVLTLFSGLLFAGLPLSAQQPDNSASNTPPGASQTTATAPAAYPSTMKVNYIRTWEPAMGITDPAAVVANGQVKDVRQTTQYFDGLGRPLQTVSKHILPSSGNDLVAPVVYDNFGREQYKYLPYGVSGTGQFRLNPFGEQASFLPGQYPGETVYYSETKFEPSPLNRVEQTLAPGNSWAGSGRGITNQYLVNTVGDAVKIWDIGPNAADYPTARPANYEAGQLYKNVTKDEADHEVVEFKDKEGHVILKKVQLTATAGSEGHDGWLCTYYVYDDLGNLRYVLPPKMVELLPGMSWSLADEVYRKELCFRYVYDHRQRMVLKQVPGAAPVEMVYDVRDRLVFSQDGNLHDKNKWLATFYDELNRPVMTALYATTQTAADLSTLLGTPTSTQTIVHQIKVPSSLVVNSHDNRLVYKAGQEIIFEPGFDSQTSEFETLLDPNGTQTTETIYASNPLSGLDQSKLEPLTYTYYDDYSYEGAKAAQPTLLSGIPYNTETQPHTDALPVSNQTKGLVTGTKVRVLEGNGANDRWLVTTTRYDTKGRVLQVLADNATGGEDIVSNLYNFSGQVLSTAQVLRNPRSTVTPEVKLLTMLSYDHGGRLLKVQKKVGDNGTVTDIATNEYDALGQLKKKTFKKSDGNELESLSYEYNIRGWLRGINKAYVDNTDGGHYFGQELNYDYGFSDNQFNGNIAGIKWRGTHNSTVKHAYGYSYDTANRLLKGDFWESPATTHSWNVNPATQFSVKMGDGSTPTSAYDANGNILRMQQEGKTGPTTSGLIDDLYYNYKKPDNTTTGNRLQGVHDLANNPASTLGDFKEITTGSTNDYAQDPNGNLTRDDNKGITGISYNHLNLPEVITIPGKGTIRYVYDAAGIKHRKTVEDLTGPQPKTTVTAYSGGLVYEDDVLRLISHEEGRIRVNTDVQPVHYTYDYFIKDHLGNVRMVLTEGSQQQLYLASMETERSATENALFSNIESSRSAKPAGYPQDATAGNQNSQVARLNGQHPDKRVGPSLVLRVMAGDTISIGAKAFYKSIGRKQDKSLVPVADMATSLLRAFGGGQPGGGGKETPGEGLSRSPLNEQFLNDGYQRMKQKEPADPAQANRPKAYLNFALFDDEFNLVDENSGVKQVKAEPDQLQTLAQDKMVIKKGGFLYVYTSNETPQDVFFDNLVVTNNPGAVLEETHYYPFGLTMAGISTKAPGKLENKYKFTGQLLDDDLGWNAYQMKWRTMDPQIGRFLQVDPLASSYVHNSTYAYAENKVTTGIDLEGLEWVSKIDGSGATNVSVNVNFSVDKNLKLSPEQIAAYQSAISSQLNSTMQLSSDGTMSGSVTYNGGDSKALGVVVPSLSLYGDASIVGGQTTFSASSVNIFDKKGNLRSPEMVANDAVHELLHTVRFEHPFEKTQGADTKLVSEGGNNYSTTSATDSKIPFNIMNYPMINIDGKKSGDLWKSTGQSPSYLTKDQIKMLLNEIKLQNNGAGVPGSSGYLNYWINTPGEEVKKKQNE